jgi:uncharacterized protein YkwD
MAQAAIDLTTLRNTSLLKHNTYRTTHHSPNMTINSSVNTTSQSWADYLATNQLFQHSTSTQRNGAGENLYVYYTTASSVAADILATKAVESWYNEVAKYDYTKPGYTDATGNFTQVVWKGSTTLGCGASQGVKTINGTQYNAFYVVCQYTPAGNVQDQFATNVLKP